MWEERKVRGKEGVGSGVEGDSVPPGYATGSMVILREPAV